MALLVPYDGSRPAQQAVEYVLEKHPDEELVFLRVVEAAGGSLEAGLNLIQEQFKEEREDIAAEIHEDVTELLEASDVEFRVEVAVGKPAQEIVEFVEENDDIEGIVLGSHGREGVSRVLLGSVAEKVVRRAPVPVTVVR
jgi:nucleotide-binding universal stress UspA family protein